MGIGSSLLLTAVPVGMIPAEAASEGYSNPLLWSCIVVIAIAVTGVVAALIYDRIRCWRLTEKANAERKVREQQREVEKRKYDIWLQNYIISNGQPDKTMVLRPDDMYGIILVYGGAKKVFLHGKTLSFKDILGCRLTDNTTTVKGKMTATTESDTGSALGRAIVGRMIGGSTGAIIGGLTAPKTTKFHKDDDLIIHDYTVVININSISTPIIQIRTGNDLLLANEIIALMNLIISRR